jgi:hypothetical protein
MGKSSAEQKKSRSISFQARRPAWKAPTGIKWKQSYLTMNIDVWQR